MRVVTDDASTKARNGTEWDIEEQCLWLDESETAKTLLSRHRNKLNEAEIGRIVKSVQEHCGLH